MTQFLQSGAELKRHRSLMQAHVGSRLALNRIEELQEIEARRFIHNFLQEPAAFPDHIAL